MKALARWWRRTAKKAWVCFHPQECIDAADNLRLLVAKLEGENERLVCDLRRRYGEIEGLKSRVDALLKEKAHA